MTATTSRPQDGRQATAFVVRLGEEGSHVHDVVGGKGVNLARLIQAGFPVPAAFCVTTSAYARFLSEANLEDKIAALISGLDVTDPRQVEAVAGEISGLILASPIPAEIAEAVTAAYAVFADEPHVAVRSSGTAEDLAEASFAGLHETFLDVRGPAEVLDAVRRCWASLWTPRATVYRQNNGFDQVAAQLAVVVQVMVDAEVAGVMFTGNPLTMATDETLINANFGLGESVVGGIATPDQFVVKNSTRQILERVLGEKEVRVVRHPRGVGTIEEETAAADRTRYTLTDRQVSELTELGARVQAHYDGFPQDTEWAFAGGQFYLLQSRPVTGVEFSWDAEVEDGLWGDIPEDPDAIWSRAFADEATTGAVSPLTYSVRYPAYSRGGFGVMTDFGGSDYSRTRRMFRYYKGELYCDTRWAAEMAEHVMLPSMRTEVVHWAHSSEREAILAAPFSRRKFGWMLLKNMSRDSSKRPYSALNQFDRFWRSAEQTRKAQGKSAAELQQLSDGNLVQYIKEQHQIEDEFGRYITFPSMVWIGAMKVALQLMVERWYDGENPNAFAEVISGGTEQTDTQIENHMLWALSERVRNSPELRRIFDEHSDAAFFTALEDSGEGRTFLTEYRNTLGRFPHRGHADRDMVYPRRGEDPGLDYRSIRMLLNGESVDPERLERAANARREAAVRDIVAKLRRRPLGRARVRAFLRAHDLFHRLIAFRDNERQNPTDLTMMSYKRGFLEMGRRLHERGRLAAADEIHYLSTTEAHDLFAGKPVNPRLLAAKITARRRDVDRMLTGEFAPPMFLRRNRPLDGDEAETGDGSGRFVGQPMSSGTVTGTARVVGRLADTGRVQQGEILVVHATDPGWTPVFLLLSGIVVQAGGPLAHAACLSREYGLPAVQLPGAMKLIPDGATITINGTTGTVTLEDR